MTEYKISEINQRADSIEAVVNIYDTNVIHVTITEENIAEYITDYPEIQIGDVLDLAERNYKHSVNIKFYASLSDEQIKDHIFTYVSNYGPLIN
jgi:hypothetical protein